MFRTDTGNFNRFLTSLGFLFLLGALLLPYFYFHDTETLRISVDELSGLTQTGREAIESRQHRVADLEIWVLAFAGILAMVGIGCLWFGGKRLRAAQRKEDEAVDRQAKKDDVEIEQMSQSEVNEKRDEQAREAVEVERLTEGRRDRPRAQQPDPGPRNTLADNRNAIARIESRVRLRLEAASFPGFEFLYEVKTSRESFQLRLDGLFRATGREGVDVLLELKVVRQPGAMSVRARQFADSMLALTTRYERLSHRKATGWLLVVVPNDSQDFSAEQLGQVKRLFERQLIEASSFTVVREEDIDRLPQMFLELFCQAK